MNTPAPDERHAEPPLESAEKVADKDRRYHHPHKTEELTEQNVDTVIRLEREVRDRRSSDDRIIDGITAFCGSMPHHKPHGKVTPPPPEK